MILDFITAQLSLLGKNSFGVTEPNFNMYVKE